MRIAHIGPAVLPIGYPLGGAVERRLAELAVAQAERGDDVLVVSLRADDRFERDRRFAEAVRVQDVTCRTRRPARDVELALRARADLRRFAPDVVHVHNNPAAAAALRGVPGVTVLSFDYMRYRGTALAPVKSAYRAAIRMFDLLLPVSQFCAEQARTWWSLPQGAFRVLPNGVNTTQFAPDADRRAAVRARLGLEGRTVIGYVGRVCSQKGSDTLVEAFTRVRRTHPDAELLVAGPAERFGTTHGTPITDAIAAAGGRWLGAVPEAELADVFRAFDIGVLPTREDEMFGMAAVEALAAGTPVVCSDLGGLPEVVPATAGRHVPPGDSDALAAALADLCAQPGLRAELAAAAPAAAHRYAWHAVAEQAAGIYAELGKR